MSSAARVTRLIELLAEEGPLTINELTSRSDLSRSTVYRTLHDLVSVGWLNRDGARFALSLKMSSLALMLVDRLDVSEVARDKMRDLATQTGEAVHLAVLDGGWVVYVERVGSSHPLTMTTPVGFRVEAHKVAAGKVLLAYTTERTSLRSLTSASELRGKDLNALESELADVRANGYAVDDEQYLKGVRSIACPIFDGNGIRAAVSVVAPSVRFERSIIPAMAKLCRNAADAVSADFRLR